MEEKKKGNLRQILSWMGRHKKTTLVILGTLWIVVIAGNNSSEEQSVTVSTKSAPAPQSQSVPSTPSVPPVKTQSKTEAQKELDGVIGLAKTANLVTSYEFSDKATVVYIGSVWYTQSVTFKKDFMAKVATLKKVITGYAHFEVRDTNSNEKVGEVTAFSQSLEVYK